MTIKELKKGNTSVVGIHFRIRWESYCEIENIISEVREAISNLWFMGQNYSK